MAKTREGHDSCLFSCSENQLVLIYYQSFVSDNIGLADCCTIRYWNPL